MDQPRSGGHHLVNLGPETGEVGGEDRGSNPPCAEQLVPVVHRRHRRFQLAYTSLSIESPQFWQVMVIEELIRTIV